MNKSDSHSSNDKQRAARASVVTAIDSRRRKTLHSQSTEMLQSHYGEQLRRLEETIAQLPEINATRVVQLHQRIMNGDYEVDSDRLAEKLMGLEQLLPQK